MISSDLEGTGLESRVAGPAASAIIDDAAAVRAVLEAYGDRLAAADVAGVVSQSTGNTAAMQPELETVVGASSLRPHTTLLSGTCAWTLRSDWTTSPSTATSGRSGRQARGRSRSALPARRNQRVSGNCSFWTHGGRLEDRAGTCTSSCRSSQEGTAPASSGSGTPIRALSAFARRWRARRGAGGHADLPARTGAGQVDVGRRRSRRPPG